MDKAVVLRGITKRFPGIVANDGISLEIEKGEVHAIVGENGAGKSTLMKILAGIYQPDEGEIHIFGKKERITSPGRAIELKIGMVHQHFMLVNRFTVLENIILGAEKRAGMAIDEQKCRKVIGELLSLYNFSLDPDARVEEISVGQAQRVEILKVLYRGAEILVLDEPTAVLAPQEVKELFANLRRLKEEGKTIIFISHKLDEVLEIADRITVLRRGRVVGTVLPSQVTKEELARMMVGKPVFMKLEKTPVPTGEILLSVKDLVVRENSGKAAVNGVSLEIRGGEIYGIAGIEGNGQKELAEAIIGLRRASAGQVTICGRTATGLSIREIRDLGVAFIPEDRHRQGLVLSMKVWENMILGYHRKKEFSKKPSLNLKAVREFTEKRAKEYSVRLSSIDQPIEGLSGGNQQKVILGRELSRDPRVIIASQPTRGLDVGAAEFVHKELLKKREEGKAILLISADLEEVLSLSDRVGVMYNGRITAEFRPEEVTPEEVGVYMLGGGVKAGEGA
ncbi:ABC transporter ATP-binding protein [Thermosediminibacter oceani]|uniref:Nucleoside ABC transporter ATP-binding protein n=1 Tax=Thermosediminibacter oceani (strain ATCC BAA-1034 / DSM 16646 / JW/IW-1228P) TaxID=555079 RepID=D9S1T4_THEOJ|nr:nucleoside ABC transporter ATP-binding protein [Thermosediminibacter oceani DSM 16646]